MSLRHIGFFFIRLFCSVINVVTGNNLALASCGEGAFPGLGDCIPGNFGKFSGKYNFSPTVKRSFLDLEVISEAALVIFVGGPGAVAWMIISFLILMMINIRETLSDRDKYPKISNNNSRVFYSMCFLAVTIYNTILFQTSQVASFVGVSSSNILPYAMIAFVILGIVAMILCRYFVYTVFYISIGVVLVYLYAAVFLLSEISLADTLHTIINNMWNLRSVVSGYLGACVIGSYMINVKSSKELRYDEKPTKSKLVFYNVVEYIVIMGLSVITGVAVVGLNICRSLSHDISEHVAANIILSHISGVACFIVPMFSVLIVMTETYYVYKHWEELMPANIRQNIFRNYIFRCVPLLSVVFMMLIGTGVINLDITGYVRTSDRISGVAVFLPLCTSMVHKLLASDISCAILRKKWVPKMA